MDDRFVYLCLINQDRQRSGTSCVRLSMSSLDVRWDWTPVPVLGTQFGDVHLSCVSNGRGLLSFDSAEVGDP